MTEVTVIDYGVGNLLSVQRGLEHCGAHVTVTGDPTHILDAKRVVLPGVGAFARGMAELRRAGLDSVVRAVASRGTPLLGICLGMQMLLEESEEFEVTAGLGIIPGRVTAIPDLDADGGGQKVPHIGWSPLVPPSYHPGWGGTILANTLSEEAVYFVHSFMAVPSISGHRIADTLYGGVPITAVVQDGRVFGCQFHPEKSGAVGLRILRSFISL
jgi:glutamine amidotransferase